MPPSPTTIPSNGKRSFLNQAHIDQSRQTSLPDQLQQTLSTEIADFFNTYFASVFTSEYLPDEHLNATVDPDLTELALTELEVKTSLNSLDTNKATGSDKSQPDF